MTDDGKLTRADFAMDPLGAIERARALGAVVPADFGVLAVSYDVSRELLADERLRPSFSAFLHTIGVTSGAFHDWMALSPLDMDGPEHRQWRQVMARAFTPRSVERLGPFLATEAQRLVDAFAGDGRCELMAAFARKLPSIGLCELIGVPVEDRDVFTGWADTIGLGFNMMMIAANIAGIDAAVVSLLDYADGLIAARRREPKDDLVTRIARAADEAGGLSEATIRGSIAGLVFAGHETTKNQIGNMVALLAELPDEWERVAREPARAPQVVEEALRVRSASVSAGRMAKDDMAIAGCPVTQGTTVIASLWGANRDPHKFANPARFDADAHQAQPHLAFGYGPHHCLGAALARAELVAALVALTRTITCPRLEAGATWLPSVGITGPVTLTISFTRR